MTEFGVTEDGEFNRKHINHILNDLEETVEQELGEVDMRQSSPIKQIIDLIAIEMAEQWEAAEESYYVSFYQDASGEALDKLLALAGFSRRELRGATGEVEFTISDSVTSPFTISSGFEVTTNETDDVPAIPFRTTETVTVQPDDSTVMVPIVALPPRDANIDKRWLGQESNVAPNTITSMSSPISGVDSVTNPNATGSIEDGYLQGRDRETDAEFRLRYENSLADGGDATLPGIESSIYEADDNVISVRAEEKRDVDEGFGPQVTVYAPEVEDDVIAQALYESRAGGADTFGNISGTAITDDGTEYTERFSRASRENVICVFNVSTSNTFPKDGIKEVRNSIIRYIGGTLDDTYFNGQAIGEDVVYDQVFWNAMDVSGAVMADLWIGKDDPNTAQETDPDDATVEDNSARGVRFVANGAQDNVVLEARLSENVAGATRAILQDDNGNDIETKDISNVSAGEWFRFGNVVSWSDADAHDIVVDAEGSDYTVGRDEDPTYNYDDGTDVSITQRYRGDLASDSSPQATRPNIDGIRINEVGESNVPISLTEVSNTSVDRVIVNER